MKTSVMLFTLVTLFGLSSQAQVLVKTELARRTAVWNSHENYSETEIEELTPSTSFKEKIPLTVVLLKNSYWSIKDVRKRIQRTENIFAQCKVSFSPIMIVSTVHALGSIATVDGMGNWVYSNINPIIEQNAAAKPVVFMTDNETEAHHGAGRSKRRGRVGHDDPTVDSAFVYYQEVDTRQSNGDIEPRILGLYEIFAHELAHVLFDLPHISDKNNILTDNNDLRSNNISKDQCELMKDNGFVK